MNVCMYVCMYVCMVGHTHIHVPSGHGGKDGNGGQKQQSQAILNEVCRYIMYVCIDL